MHSTEVRSPSPARGNERPIDRSRVTVILPTYNRAERLRRCLDALLACDLAGTEVRLRVVDDGSPDETADVVRECASAAPPGLHIEYVRQENQGCCPARNSGLGGAATDLLLFIDDDCIPEQG